MWAGKELHLKIELGNSNWIIEQIMIGIFKVTFCVRRPDLAGPAANSAAVKVKYLNIRNSKYKILLFFLTNLKNQL